MKGESKQNVRNKKVSAFLTVIRRELGKRALCPVPVREGDGLEKLLLIEIF